MNLHALERAVVTIRTTVFTYSLRVCTVCPSSIQISTVHTLPSYSLNIHFNIILPPTLMYFERLIVSRFPNQNLIRIFKPTYMLHVQLISPYADQSNNR
jgi:hypothetical protein